jgi:Flp pilus assembly protein TadD
MMSTATTTGAMPELRQILNVSEAAMDHAMGFAYQLYVAGHHLQAVTLCRALIACDRRYWWPHSLLAASLRRLERHDEALAAVNQGLVHEPRQPKLLLMRRELLITIGRRDAAAEQLPVESFAPGLKLTLGV